MLILRIACSLAASGERGKHASTICARVSGETRCTSSNQRAHRRQKSAPLDPDVPHECPKLVLNPRGSQRRASRRLPPFQQSWLSERLRPTRSRERPRGSLERCWPCFHTTWRSAGRAVRVGSLELAKSEVVGKKKGEADAPSLRRCGQAHLGGGSTIVQPTVLGRPPDTGPSETSVGSSVRPCVRGAHTRHARRDARDGLGLAHLSLLSSSAFHGPPSLPSPEPTLQC